MGRLEGFVERWGSLLIRVGWMRWAFRIGRFALDLGGGRRDVCTIVKVLRGVVGCGWIELRLCVVREIYIACWFGSRD
jgi:hypothetical protein